MRALPRDRERLTVDIAVNARHADVSPDLRDATRRKVEHLERFASDVRSVEVEFSDLASRRNVDAHTCEILVHLKGQLVKGVASGAERAVALDLAIEKVTHQLRRLHERRLATRHGGRHREKPGLQADAVGPELELDIVRTKRFATKPMDAEEAALQMEMLGHDFFLFTSTESGQAAVVYRRRDGRFGLIEATG